MTDRWNNALTDSLTCVFCACMPELKQCQFAIGAMDIFG